MLYLLPRVFFFLSQLYLSGPFTVLLLEVVVLLLLLFLLLLFFCVFFLGGSGELGTCPSLILSSLLANAGFCVGPQN